MKTVVKRNGEIAHFDEGKFRKSLERVGASGAEIARISKYIQEHLSDGMTTHELYKMAYAQLRSKSTKAAGRYRLKKAIIDMGPTGYPFEHLVGELLQSEGFRVQVGIVSQGLCVSHELDVVAENYDRRIMVECKFHNDIRRKSDVKVALYIKSRFLDMRDAWIKSAPNSALSYEGWIVTNTRFTGDALQYGLCAGLNMISWDYPSGNSLRDWIDKSGFHPITVLQSLTKAEKKLLLEEDVVLCRNLLQNPLILNKLGKTERQIQKVLTEARIIVAQL